MHQQEFPARLLKRVTARTMFWENFEWKRRLILDTDQSMQNQLDIPLFEPLFQHYSATWSKVKSSKIAFKHFFFNSWHKSAKCAIAVWIYYVTWNLAK